MSLYAEYIKERTNREIIETEQGFVTYVSYKDGLMVEDLYVRPEFRKQGLAIKFVYQVIELVKVNGFKTIYICVAPGVESPYVGATAMCKALLNHGCKLEQSFNNLLILSKEI